MWPSCMAVIVAFLHPHFTVHDRVLRWCGQRFLPVFFFLLFRCGCVCPLWFVRGASNGGGGGRGDQGSLSFVVALRARERSPALHRIYVDALHTWSIYQLYFVDTNRLSYVFFVWRKKHPQFQSFFSLWTKKETLGEAMAWSALKKGPFRFFRKKEKSKSECFFLLSTLSFKPRKNKNLTA